MTIIERSNSECCQNCGSTLEGEFCANCGQKDKETRRPFVLFVQEFLFTVLELDGRAYRTVWYLCSKPGFLSSEYVAGKRASYTPPLRLFLVITIGFFLLVSMVGSIGSLENSINGSASTQVLTEGLDSEDSLTFGFSLGDEGDGAGSTGIDQEDVETSKDELEDIVEFISGIDIPFVSVDVSQRLSTFFVKQTEENFQELIADPQNFLLGSLEYVSLFMLVLMPFLALVLQLFYISQKRYYVEYFIFTLHNISFLVFAMFVLWLIGFIEEAEIVFVSAAFSWLNVLITLWIIAYFYLSLRQFLGQGRVLTFFKYATISSVYSIGVSFGLTVFFLVFFLFS